MFKTHRQALALSLLVLMLSACANPGTRKIAQPTPDFPPRNPPASIPSEGEPAEPARVTTEPNEIETAHQRLRVTAPTQSGQLAYKELTEVSGLAASHRREGVLWGINDSGNEAGLYAMDERGGHLGKWPVATINRDWEDLASIWYNGDAYLLIGETGDNLRLHSEYQIHILQEPLLDDEQQTIYPLATLSFRYSDGKHNVEAIGLYGDSIILISKEPLKGSTHSPGRVYRLPFQLSSNIELLEASYLTTLAEQNRSIETRLAAALTGVSLNNVTALDIDEVNRIAYLLTYRHVIKLALPEITDDAIGSLRDGLSQRGQIIRHHGLDQAEALAVDDLGQIWLTSENAKAPLWVLPAAN